MRNIRDTHSLSFERNKCVMKTTNDRLKLLKFYFAILKLY